MNTEYLQFRKVGFLTVPLQITAIIGLFIVTVFYGNYDFQNTGLLFGYPFTIRIFFVPIYEEIIFRWFILTGLKKWMKNNAAIIISSILFGLWHLKNISHLSTLELTYQMVYTALIIGPILAIVTIRTRTIWIAVILHYLNNILSASSWDIIHMLNKIV